MAIHVTVKYHQTLESAYLIFHSFSTAITRFWGFRATSNTTTQAKTRKKNKKMTLFKNALDPAKNNFGKRGFLMFATPHKGGSCCILQFSLDNAAQLRGSEGTVSC